MQAASEFQEPKLSRNLELVALLREIGQAHHVEPGVVATAWTVHHPAVTAAIVGARNGTQVEGIIAAASFQLTEQEFSRIESFRSAKR